MKNLAIIFLILGLAACQTDPVLPCQEDGPVGELCREYRYAEGQAIGLVEFEYDQENTIRSKVFDQQLNLVKTIVQHFENGQTVVIAEQFPDMESQIQTWHYNDNDSLFQIVYGTNDSLTKVIYEDGRRLREEYLVDKELQRWVGYRYYQDDGKLYRKTFYNTEDSILNYQNYQYFSTGQNRITYYTPSHQIVGRKVLSFSQLGFITSMEFTNAEGLVTEHENYIYDVAGKLIEKTRSDQSQSTKSVYLYY